MIRNKLSLSLFLIASIIFVTAGFKGCSNQPSDPAGKKAQALKFARSLNTAIATIGPIVVAAKPALAVGIGKATAAASKITTAIEQDSTTSIPLLVADILPVFNQIAAEFTQNRAVLVGLAVADIALEWFAENFVAALPAGVSQTGGSSELARATQLIVEFHAGAHFRARDAKSGRFVTIEYAQVHPDTTVIERVKK